MHAFHHLVVQIVIHDIILCLFFFFVYRLGITRSAWKHRDGTNTSACTWRTACSASASESLTRWTSWWSTTNAPRSTRAKGRRSFISSALSRVHHRRWSELSPFGARPYSCTLLVFIPFLVFIFFFCQRYSFRKNPCSDTNGLTKQKKTNKNHSRTSGILKNGGKCRGSSQADSIDKSRLL